MGSSSQRAFELSEFAFSLVENEAMWCVYHNQ